MTRLCLRTPHRHVGLAAFLAPVLTPVLAARALTAPALACVLALTAAGALADDTASPYGERLVRSGQQWSDGTLPAPPAGFAAPAPADAAQSLAAYIRQIEALQRQGGPYAAGLVENLEAMADLQARSGDLAGAQSLYTRALHLQRINEGLRSEGQLSLLQRLISLARQTGDLEQLDDRYDYLYFLQGAGRQPRDEAAVTVQLAYLRWQREALRLGVRSSQGRSRLLALLDLNDRLLGDDGAAQALTPALRWQLVQSQLRNLYLLQDSLPPPFDEAGMRLQRAYRPLSANELDHERQRLEQQRRNGLLRGRKLLQDYLATAPAGAPYTFAAQLALADWFQWHGQSRRAGEFYAALAKDLIEAGAEAQWRDWFDAPVELPDNGAFWQALVPGQAADGPVTVSFEVTEQGRVRNAQVVSVPDAAENAQFAVLRELRDVRFRPRLDRQGQPLASALRRDYLWLPLRRSQWP
ncbi:energy transducer TonB [Parahaliea mediterranea]|uniref:energy transducer TonB n=1 Tax=Parahaliea mediterranea TaxID=651086 RepID=UPI000E2E4770|nr:energy transducer TonB [Parahaliea mediterranea]